MDALKITQKWIKIGLFNLAIVALYGMIMRYKIAFDFPYFTQKNLLLAHSNFAFIGWISHVLYTGIFVILLKHRSQQLNIKKYEWLLRINLMIAYGLLLTFTILGYDYLAVFFSVLYVVCTLVFSSIIINDFVNTKLASKPWIILAAVLNIISVLGPLTLVYMLITKSFDSQVYVGTLYYYLHFQYNAWFLFASIGIVVSILPENSPSLKKHFNAFALTIVPTLFLSLLWLKLPLWLFIITLIAAFIQLFAWIHLLYKFWPILNSSKKIKWISLFFKIAAIALTFKFLLQVISVIPELSHLVFGIRSIVIAYIHLILLGVFSVFLIAYGFHQGYLSTSSFAKYSAVGFLVGILLNEIGLGIQGFAGLFYIPIPHVQEFLFVASLVLFSSALLLFISQLIKQKS